MGILGNTFPAALGPLSQRTLTARKPELYSVPRKNSPPRSGRPHRGGARDCLHGRPTPTIVTTFNRPESPDRGLRPLSAYRDLPLFSHVRSAFSSDPRAGFRPISLNFPGSILSGFPRCHRFLDLDPVADGRTTPCTHLQSIPRHPIYRRPLHRHPLFCQSVRSGISRQHGSDVRGPARDDPAWTGSHGSEPNRTSAERLWRARLPIKRLSEQPTSRPLSGRTCS